MNPQQTLERLKTLAASMTAAQRTSLVVAFVTVMALMTGSAYLLNHQNYVLLYSDMDAEAAADVVGRLKAAKVPYELVDGGRSVRVPENRAPELKLELASQGLPSSGRIGFEIFDKISFGATEFLEQVNFRRALEGELARTIGTLQEVSSARVHIAVARASLFEAREQPAKASVVLKLRGNRPLPAATSRSISALVAAAVEGLRPEAVVILDSYGRSLAKPGEGDDGPLGGQSMERQLVLERDLSNKLMNLLEPVVGPGRVRVNVAVRLNAQSEEQTEERWDPNAAVIRSKQTTSDTTPVGGAGSAGVAGARANMPEPPAKPADNAPPEVPTPAPAEAVRLAGRSAETTNYEISHVTRHTVRPHGEISRLSVAVILDDALVTAKGKDGNAARQYKPREREELLKIQNIVSGAVGLDTGRGDLLTVENVAFEDRLSIEEGPAPGFWRQQWDRVGQPEVLEVGRVAGIVVFGLLAFLFVVRPMVKRALAIPLRMPEPIPAAAQALPGGSGGPAELPPTIEDLEGAIEAELAAAEVAQGSDKRRVPVLAKRLGGLTLKEPEAAARLVRAWLAEDRGGR